MKLHEWCKMNGLPAPTVSNSGAVSIVCSEQDVQEFAELWHLEDYAVSTRGGMAIWFVPIEPDRPIDALDVHKVFERAGRKYCYLYDRRRGQYGWYELTPCEHPARIHPKSDYPDCEHLNGCGNPMNNQC